MILKGTMFRLKREVFIVENGTGKAYPLIEEHKEYWDRYEGGSPVDFELKEIPVFIGGRYDRNGEIQDQYEYIEHAIPLTQQTTHNG